MVNKLSAFAYSINVTPQVVRQNFGYPSLYPAWKQFTKMNNVIQLLGHEFSKENS